MHSKPEDLIDLVKPFLVQEKILGKGEELNGQWLTKAIHTLQERSKTLLELAHSLQYYISDDIEYNVKAQEKFLTENSLPILCEVRESLEKLDRFTADVIEKVFVSIAGKQNIKLGKVAQPVRVSITGKTESPGIFEVLEIVGREKTLKRLEKAIQTINAK
jgi:glutamyl-tRNA synthetase